MVFTRARPAGQPAPDDQALAWALAAAVRPHLNRSEADQVFIAIGIGETFAAIDALITVVARDRVPLGEDLRSTVVAWLDCYRGQDADPRLRRLLAEATGGTSVAGASI